MYYMCNYPSCFSYLRLLRNEFHSVSKGRFPIFVSVHLAVPILKMILKLIAVILFFIAAFLVWFDLSRAFYCLSDDKCVTVWKRLGNKCYVVPGKYYGIYIIAVKRIYCNNKYKFCRHYLARRQ